MFPSPHLSVNTHTHTLPIPTGYHCNSHNLAVLPEDSFLIAFGWIRAFWGLFNDNSCLLDMDSLRLWTCMLDLEYKFPRLVSSLSSSLSLVFFTLPLSALYCHFTFSNWNRRILLSVWTTILKPKWECPQKEHGGHQNVQCCCVLANPWAEELGPGIDHRNGLV